MALAVFILEAIGGGFECGLLIQFINATRFLSGQHLIRKDYGTTRTNKQSPVKVASIP
jgi:hypothetical protein